MGGDISFQEHILDFFYDFVYLGPNLIENVDFFTHFPLFCIIVSPCEEIDEIYIEVHFLF